MDLVRSSINSWIKIISVILGIFVFTLGEIALNDIEKKLYKIKNENDIFESLLTKEEKSKVDLYSESIKNFITSLSNFEYQLNTLDTDIKSKRSTLEQLLENQKVNPNLETQNQISLYQRHFLELQFKKDKLSSENIELDFKVNNLKREKEAYQTQLEKKYSSELSKIETANEKGQQIKVLSTQIVLILFLFAVGTFLIIKFKKSDFIFPILGYNFAVYIIIFQAIYIHSPFKLKYYAFIIIAILICIFAIFWLLKNIKKISKKQNTVLVKKNLMLGKCPKCSTDISLKEFTKGNYKGQKLKTFIIIAIIIGALLGNGSGIIIFINNLSNIDTNDLVLSILLIVLPWILLYIFIQVLNPFQQRKIPDPELFNNTNCPVCGLAHIVKCEKCGSIRHNLLSFCNKCGAEKKFEEV